MAARCACAGSVAGLRRERRVDGGLRPRRSPSTSPVIRASGDVRISASLPAATMSRRFAVRRLAQKSTSARTRVHLGGGVVRADRRCPGRRPRSRRPRSPAGGAARQRLVEPGVDRRAGPVAPTSPGELGADHSATSSATQRSSGRLGRGGGADGRAVIVIAPCAAGDGDRISRGGQVGAERRPRMRAALRAGSVRPGEVREAAEERLVVPVHAVAGRDHEVRQQGELGVDDVVREPPAVEGQRPEGRPARESGGRAERQRELVGQQDVADRRRPRRPCRPWRRWWSARCRSRSGPRSTLSFVVRAIPARALHVEGVLLEAVVVRRRGQEQPVEHGVDRRPALAVDLRPSRRSTDGRGRPHADRVAPCRRAWRSGRGSRSTGRWSRRRCRRR